MNGGLTIESEVGHGTAMRMLFPVTAEVEHPEKSLSKEDSGKMRSGGNLHILIVDDEKAITKLGHLMLEKQGCSVETYNDAYGALEAIQDNERRFDAAILDYTMPGMTGLQLVQQIAHWQPNLRITLATGMLEQSDIDNNKPDNIVQIIKKPYSLKVLTEAIDITLQNSPD